MNFLGLLKEETDEAPSIIPFTTLSGYVASKKKYIGKRQDSTGIVCIGVSTLPLKNTTPLFLAKHPLNLQTVKAPLYRQSPL